MKTDEYFMKLALSLAKKGIGNVSPNPMVGAVVVKGGKIAGKGYHKNYGAPHAEVNAIMDAGSLARGATLYLNLEPCCHYGKTPPCTDAVINAGIKRVVAGMKDPNPKVSGKGFRLLKKAGIKVDTGVLEEEAMRLNEGFIKRMATGRPFVILKIAASLDGKTATKTGESKWITSGTSRHYVHKIRAGVDAIMTGIGTVLSDDPVLTARAGRTKKQPIRIVADSLLRVPQYAKLVESNTLFLTTEAAPLEKIEMVRSKGADVKVFRSKNGRIDMTLAMEYLGKQGINSIMVEGGAELSASLLEEGLIDKVMFFYAPKFIGGIDAPGMIDGIGINRLSDAVSIKLSGVKRFDEDVMIEGYVYRDH